MSYIWRGIPLDVFSRGDFRQGKKSALILETTIGGEHFVAAVLSEADRDWPIEILANVYMPAYLTHIGTVSAWMQKRLPYPIEIMIIEDEDAFLAASRAYDLSRT